MDKRNTVNLYLCDINQSFIIKATLSYLIL